MRGTRERRFRLLGGLEKRSAGTGGDVAECNAGFAEGVGIQIGCLVYLPRGTNALPDHLADYSSCSCAGVTGLFWMTLG